MVEKRYAPLQLFAFAAVPLLLAFAASAAVPPAKKIKPVPRAKRLSYNRDIRPILADNCFSCHGPDSGTRKAGLRLDRPADAFAFWDGEHHALVKGDPVASELIHRILLPDNDGMRMPPSDSGHKSLTDEQKRILIRWVEEGAEYEPQWSYIPPKKSPLPVVRNIKWVRNPIDRFVLARLEQEGLTPAPEADKRTLIRRLSLDLTGLPPEPADVEAFVKDTSPNAYEKVVDRYLASPHWGEHRGRYWLDAARYGDTHGIHFDNYREMWSYRDWVIGAYNKNMPFDEFTREQLAGDLLPNPTMDQRIATGFNRCNITTNEGGSIDEEVAVMYTRDRTETAAQVFMGTTAGCAVCHDHKFDPLSQKEFYSLSAFFNNTEQKAMDGNIKDTPPIIAVPLPKDRARFATVQTEIADTKQAVEARKVAARSGFDQWLGGGEPAKLAAGNTVSADALNLYLPLNEGTGTQINGTFKGTATVLAASAEPGWEGGALAEKAFVRKNNSTVAIAEGGDFDTADAFTCSVWVKLPIGNNGGSLLARMDNGADYRGWDLWVENNRIGSHRINKWPDDAVKVVSRNPVTTGQWHHVTLVCKGGLGSAPTAIYVDGVPQALDVPTDTLKSTIRTTVPLKVGQRNTSDGMADITVQDVRLYGRALTPDEVVKLGQGARASYLATRTSTPLNPAEKQELFGWWLGKEDKPYQALTTKVGELENEDRAIRMRGTVAHVAQERKEPAIAYVLFRGEYDKRRDKVTPNTPAFLPPMPASYPKNRLGLANWLLRPENPLTTRVTVNRFWQELFGNGLVRTAGDFGVTGEEPSHPELLDWLAVDFRENRWDMKRFFKQVVMSATYRQAATVTPEKKRKDETNRLLSRGPRFRMDAEMVRDYALATSGLLVDKIGGPSVRTYQPDGVWEAVGIIGSDTRQYTRDNGENLYRRSMYTFWKRSAPPASLEIFNAPSREVCTMRRERTDTPLQALVTMNDVQYVEAARNLAERTLKNGGSTPKSRFDYIARRLLARPLRQQEEMVLEISLDELEDHYKANPKAAEALLAYGDSKTDTRIATPEQKAAWTMVINEMMNMDEVLNK